MKKILLPVLAVTTYIIGSSVSFAQTNVFDNVIVTSPNHTYLEAAIIQEGLQGALQDPTASLTVFAPDDQAFTNLATALGTDINGLLALPNLDDILLYHVLGIQVPSSGVTNGAVVQPLSATNTLKLTVDGTAVFVNQAQVNAADLTTANGVVHSIDAVVLPYQTVADIAIGSTDHTTLVAAVIEARLLPALTDPLASLTVFAPTDAAFTAALGELGLTAGELLASPDLTDILLYHVLGAEVLSSNLSNGQIATPLNNVNSLKVTIDGANVFVNQAQVTFADLLADNGAVHVLDAVVLPNTTVADIAINSTDHTVLEAAVIEARLLPALTDPFATLTVFAPTDAAFTTALGELGLTAAELLASPDLTDILLYHVLGAQVLSTDLSNGQLANPLNTNNTLKVTIDGTNVFINQAQVMTADILADNGAVHVLDAVVLPDTTVADIALNSGIHNTLVAAIKEAKLFPALTDPFASLTVFAPKDGAFEILLTNLGITAAELLASTDLADILLHHVLGSEVLSGSLSNGQLVTPLNSTNTLKVTLTGTGAFINQALVTLPDVQADNGVVHVLDEVLLAKTTVVDVAISSPAHTTLVSALIQARLLNVLTDPFAEFTVFAPTNTAFDNLATALGTDLNGILALPNLAEVLTYHVVSGTALSTDLVEGPVATVNGTNIFITLDNGVIVNDANVTAADLLADNGVVHVLDKVLLPSFAGIDEADKNLISAYPNPAVNELFITNAEGSAYAVTDMLGRIATTGKVEGGKILLNGINAGTYILSVETELGVQTLQIIKE
jgi:uncharacterized surface protein with fasciclin (FAS1) repeats